MSAQIKNYLKQFCIVAIFGNLLNLVLSFPYILNILNIDFDRLFRDYWFIIFPIFRSGCIFLLLLPLLPVFIFYDKRFERNRLKQFLMKFATAILYGLMLLLGWFAFVVYQINTYPYFDIPKVTMIQLIRETWFIEMLPVLCVIVVLMGMATIQSMRISIHTNTSIIE